MVDENKLPRVCDLGLSSEIDDEGMIDGVGTVNWMAPEVMRRKTYDRKVDVYVYRLIVWEMLTGEVPFHDKLPAQVSYDLCNGITPAEIPEDTSEYLV